MGFDEAPLIKTLEAGSQKLQFYGIFNEFQDFKNSGGGRGGRWARRPSDPPTPTHETALLALMVEHARFLHPISHLDLAHPPSFPCFDRTLTYCYIYVI